jgi:DNA polymerase III subunit chi
VTEVRFYHLTRSTLESALPKMLEKTRERDQHAVVLCGSPERVEALASYLWTYNDRGFLPHGSAKDGRAEDQPIWLSDQDERPNGAQVLFLTDGAVSEKVGDYELCAVLFDGNNSDAVSASRDQWRVLKDAGHEVTYWQQEESGKWEKKT